MMSVLTSNKSSAVTLNDKRLVVIGKEIEVKLAKADTYDDKAADMMASVDVLLAEAESRCTDAALFQRWKKTQCPSLGKSRAYELRAIASGKKSVEQSRAETRARVAKHRAKPVTERASVTNVVPLQAARIGGSAALLATQNATARVLAIKDEGEDQAQVRREEEERAAAAAAVVVVDAIGAENARFLFCEFLGPMLGDNPFLMLKIIRAVNHRLRGVVTAIGGGA